MHRTLLHVNKHKQSKQYTSPPTNNRRQTRPEHRFHAETATDITRNLVVLLDLTVYIWVTRQASYQKQELLTIREHLRHPGFVVCCFVLRCPIQSRESDNIEYTTRRKTNTKTKHSMHRTLLHVNKHKQSKQYTSPPTNNRRQTRHHDKQ
jgi:hypothetical protein